MPIRAAKLQQTIGMTNKFLRVFLKYFLTDTFMPSRARIYNKVSHLGCKLSLSFRKSLSSNNS